MNIENTTSLCILGDFGRIIEPRSNSVIEHAAIKDTVSIGHTAKIGGEVEASIIESFTNKQHHGFLGHSYLGSWINLGAGTCNSDLKNTYGNVKMEYRGSKVDTGMQFVGCIMGDYAKTAINTGIFTGKLIGVGNNGCRFITLVSARNSGVFIRIGRLSCPSNCDKSIFFSADRRARDCLPALRKDRQICTKITLAIRFDHRVERKNNRWQNSVDSSSCQSFARHSIAC